MALAKKAVVSTFSMAMMTAAAVVSLRGLPMMAKEQLTLFIFIAFATLIFLIPAALVSAEFGGAFGEKGGGVYTWVKEAFGARWGFVAIWLQWIQNVVWYPTVLAFSAAAIAYVVGKPDLANNGFYVGAFCIAVYWAATWVSLRGVDAIAKVTSWTFLIGTVLPGVIIMILAGIWIFQGNPIAMLHPIATDSASVMSMAGGHAHPRYFPSITGLGDIAFLAGIILLFAGVEVHAVHANEMTAPKRQFPFAILIASVVIILLFTLGSFAVATVLPNQDINLQEGLMKAFQQIFDKFGMGWATPVVCLLLAFGGIGGVMSWISGPSRGLLWTAQEGEIPPFLAKTNDHGVQISILIVQGVIVTALSLTYFVMKDVSVAFFLLSAMTITLYLIMYMLMYAAAIRLRYSQPDLKRSYRVPGGSVGMWIIAGVGFAGVLFAFVVGFFPPSQLPVGSPALYFGLVAGGTVLFTAIPLLITVLKRASWRPAAIPVLVPVAPVA
ncbi:MAG: amino acid permease [Ancalomicrobiaceae bacterium]|nr:amino acid permease [Ancalomicrobiaceae bacterium]